MTDGTQRRRRRRIGHAAVQLTIEGGFDAVLELRHRNGKQTLERRGPFPTDTEARELGKRILEEHAASVSGFDTRL
jgi:hypothetical protein